MTASAGPCRYCDRTHDRTLLCDPARRVLDALYARGTEFNMPTVEFSEPLPADHLGLEPGDVLVAQLVVKAAAVPAAGVSWPAVILTGTDAHRHRLPQWVVPGNAEALTAMSRLFADMVDLAVRTARKTGG